MKKAVAFLLTTMLLSTLVSCGANDDFGSDQSGKIDTLPALVQGEMISGENAELTLIDIVVMDIIKDRNVRYEAEEDTDYLCIIYNIKNIGAHEDDLVPNETLSNIAVYDGKYEYTDVWMGVAEEFYYGFSPLPPLRDLTLYCIFTIPNEVSENSEKIQVKTILNNIAYRSENTKNVSDFQRKMAVLAEVFSGSVELFFDTFYYAEIYDAESSKQAVNEAYPPAKESLELMKLLLSDIKAPDYYINEFNHFLDMFDTWDKYITPVYEAIDADFNTLGDVMQDAIADFDDATFFANQKKLLEIMPFLELTNYDYYD